MLFAEEGAKVVVNYAKDASAAGDVVNKIKEKGGKAVAVQADVANLKDHPKLVDAALNEFGKIDILYHNAALHIHTKTALEDLTEEVWDTTYNIIVKGPYFLTKLVVPHMQKQTQGNILFTSTSSSYVIVPLDPHYMTAKSAVNTLVKILAGWLGPQIRVNCVVPGFIATDMFRHHPPQVWEGLAAGTPMKRMGTPMDIARAALFLVSPESSYLTGCFINVDGGRSASETKERFASAAEVMLPGLKLYDIKGYERWHDSITSGV